MLRANHLFSSHLVSLSYFYFSFDLKKVFYFSHQKFVVSLLRCYFTFYEKLPGAFQKGIKFGLSEYVFPLVKDVI